MKACDLIKAIEAYPDFEVELTHVVHEEGQWPIYNTYKVAGVADVGHSSKVIILDGGESDNTISDNTTNGDAIKAMFPNIEIDYHEKSDFVDSHVTVYIKDCDTCQDYSCDWWNAPYKGGKQ